MLKWHWKVKRVYSTHESWTLTPTLASYPTISWKSSPARKYNSFARTRKPICWLLTKDLNTKLGHLFCSPYVFVTKPGRQTVTYKLAFKLYITICATCRITLTGRGSVFLSFVCFSCFRFKYRRQVRSVLGRLGSVMLTRRKERYRKSWKKHGSDKTTMKRE